MKFLLFVCLESESTPTHRPTPLPGPAGPPLVSREESEVIEALKVRPQEMLSPVLLTTIFILGLVMEVHGLAA